VAALAVSGVGGSPAECPAARGARLGGWGQAAGSPRAVPAAAPQRGRSGARSP